MTLVVLEPPPIVLLLPRPPMFPPMLVDLHHLLPLGANQLQLTLLRPLHPLLHPLLLMRKIAHLLLSNLSDALDVTDVHLVNGGLSNHLAVLRMMRKMPILSSWPMLLPLDLH